MELGTALGTVLTLVVLEVVLSFDNAAILTVMSRRLPIGSGRRRALNYGLLIAYVLRVMAILGAYFLIQNQIFLLIGGAYLIFLFVRHSIERLRRKPHHAASPSAKVPKSRFGLSPLTIVVIQIGFIDLAFALDQVIAAVGFTQEWLLIIIAATIGLVSLRILAPFLGRLMDWLPTLEDMAYVAVGFVGILLVGSHLGPIARVIERLGGNLVLHEPPGWLQALGVHSVEKGLGYELADLMKFLVTLGFFAMPILVKLVFKVPRSQPGHHRAVERAMEPEDPRLFQKP